VCSAGSRWAEPDVQHLRQLMRSAAQNPSEAEAKGTAARARMVERWEMMAESPLA
jgi:hypothetical protein